MGRATIPPAERLWCSWCGAPNASRKTTKRLRPLPPRQYSPTHLQRSRADQQQTTDDTRQRRRTKLRSQRQLVPNEAGIQKPKPRYWLRSRMRIPRRELGAPPGFASCPATGPWEFQLESSKTGRRSGPSTPVLLQRKPSAGGCARNRPQ